MREEKVALLTGLFCVAMMIGVYFFEYVVLVPPCEMCYWQRWPHEAAIVAGLGGAALFYAHVIDRRGVAALAWLSLVLVLSSALIGTWQAGVEWRWFPGPDSCTGPRFELTAMMNLNAPVVSCEDPGWRLFGISLAGYNFLCSTTVAVLGALLLTRKIKLPFAWADAWANR
jgi:disulfide bond formation protein DsbB